MCGICGILNFGSGEPVRPEVVEAMANAIQNRGPDGGGIHVDGSLGLGHRRLAVIDLGPGGRQPMTNEDGTLWLTFNGEIYNYRDLRSRLSAAGHRFRSQTDSEVILHLYEDKGTDLAVDLEGMFAFALWDAPRRRLLLARDRLGIKPLCTFLTRDGLLFASDSRAFLAAPGFPGSICRRALASYTSHLSVVSHAAIFEGVAKVPPGTVVVVEDGRVSTRRYWELPRPDPAESRPEGETAEQLRDLLARVTETHLVADVPVGAFLSGGLDSSAVAALVASSATRQLETFSVAFPEVPRVDESRYARLMADRLGTRHTEFDMHYDFVATLEQAVTHCDEPFAVWSAYALYEICRLARSRVKVVLTGDGGDELFAGYPRHHLPLAGSSSDLLRHAAPIASRLLASGLHHRWLWPPPLWDVAQRLLWRGSRRGWSPGRRYLGLVRYVDAPVMLEVFDRGVLVDEILPQLADDEERFITLFDQSDGGDEVNRRLEVDLRTSLVDEMLTKVDRMSMAFGLEARVPLLDHRLVEFACSIPGSLKNGPLGVKHIFKRAVQGDLPSEILGRGKAGFNLPLAKWFRGPLAPYLRERLSAPSLRASGVFDPKVVSRVLDEHIRRDRDHSAIVFAVLVWVLWHQQLASARTPAAGNRA
jgi:asparagine synthase (glutamine-hydrolysing)